MRDRLFHSEESDFESFAFAGEVVEVFDDMVERSVPHYAALQTLMAQLALRCYGGHPIYDMGCSTGNTLLRLAELSPKPLSLVGIDRSPAMLEASRAKLSKLESHHTCHLVEADLCERNDFPHGPPGAVIFSLVAQFLRPVRRQQILDQTFAELVPGGCLLMVEKTVEEQHRANALFIELHHEFKRQNGYSDLEIMRKREALENRLIPFLPQENLEMLKKAGFPHPTIFFSWLNFQGYLAIKT